ncbi:MAG: glycosyltransferase family 2 protein [Candidatus Dojkabacteria bacterium]|nr:MAG: glycosyltransferase family 2 protein [Candidatus Dojkabacteria bacterium]
MKLVVYMPAHNEEATIGLVIDKITNVFHSEYIAQHFSETEIVVLNDNSTDKTKALAQEKGAIVFDIRGESRGVGRVIRLGLEKLLTLKPDVAVGIDADDQFDPNDIPRLVAPIVEGKADMVTGTKFQDKKNPPAGISKVKLWGNYVVTGLVNFLLKTNFTDVSCGFRAYSREALLQMNIWGDRTYVQEAFLDFYYKGMTIKEVPIKAVYFKDRKSRVFRFGGGIFNYAIKSLMIMFTAMRDYNPFNFFGSLATFFITLSLFPGLFLVGHYFFVGSFSPYIFLGFIAAMLFGIGMFLHLIALLADMLARMRMNQEKLIYQLRKQAMNSQQ